MGKVMRVNSLPPPAHNCHAHARSKQQQQKQLKLKKIEIYFMFNNLCKRKTLTEYNLLTLKQYRDSE